MRGRIKAILDAETVMGHRTGSNPARYVDHLQLVLPRSKKRSQVRHHAALPWEDIPSFVRDLEQRPRRAARVLHLLIFTATRTNEVRFARPEEFDLDTRVWSIPGDRTPTVEYGNADSPETHVPPGDHRAWFPVDVPRLGGRMYGVCIRSVRCVVVVVQGRLGIAWSLTG